MRKHHSGVSTYIFFLAHFPVHQVFPCDKSGACDISTKYFTNTRRAIFHFSVILVSHLSFRPQVRLSAITGLASFKSKKRHVHFQIQKYSPKYEQSTSLCVVYRRSQFNCNRRICLALYIHAYITPISTQTPGTTIQQELGPYTLQPSEFYRKSAASLCLHVCSITHSNLTITAFR